MEIGEKIAYARKHKGWLQTDLGKLTGLSKGAISQLEAGKNKPNAKNAKKLSEALGLPMEVFIGNNPESIALTQNIDVKPLKPSPEMHLAKLRELGVAEEKIMAALELLL